MPRSVRIIGALVMAALSVAVLAPVAQTLAGTGIGRTGLTVLLAAVGLAVAAIMLRARSVAQARRNGLLALGGTVLTVPSALLAAGLGNGLVPDATAAGVMAGLFLAAAGAVGLVLGVTFLMSGVVLSLCLRAGEARSGP